MPLMVAVVACDLFSTCTLGSLTGLFPLRVVGDNLWLDVLVAGTQNTSSLLTLPCWVLYFHCRYGPSLPEYVPSREDSHPPGRLPLEVNPVCDLRAIPPSCWEGTGKTAPKQ